MDTNGGGRQEGWLTYVIKGSGDEDVVVALAEAEQNAGGGG